MRNDSTAEFNGRAPPGIYEGMRTISIRTWMKLHKKDHFVDTVENESASQLNTQLQTNYQY